MASCKNAFFLLLLVVLISFSYSSNRIRSTRNLKRQLTVTNSNKWQVEMLNAVNEIRRKHSKPALCYNRYE